MDGIVEIDNPDQFYELEHNAWIDDLTTVADDYSEVSGMSFERLKDQYNTVRRWGDGQGTMDLVLHVERDPKTGEYLSSVFLLPMKLEDFQRRQEKGEEAKYWKRDGVFFLDSKKRKRVLNAVKKELPKTWERAITIGNVV